MRAPQWKGQCDSHSVSGARADVCHNGDDDMLLDGEGTGVERGTKDLDLRDITGPETHEGEGNQLGHDLYE